MTHGARDSVGGEDSLGIRARAHGQIGEDGAGSALSLRGHARHRHVAPAARLFDRVGRLGIVDHFAPNRCLPVGIAGAVGHHRGHPIVTDGDIETVGGRDALVAREAAIRGSEEHVSGCRCPPSWASPTGFRRAGRDHGTGLAHGQRGADEQDGGQQPALIRHHHPSKNPPSNQSRRTYTRSRAERPVAWVAGRSTPTFARTCCRVFSEICI